MSTLPAATPPSPAACGPTGLVLSGGGARAAYQVGVLAAVAQIRREAGVGGMKGVEIFQEGGARYLRDLRG